MTDSATDSTWAILLAKWTDFARASVALPPTAEGDRWRDAVAPIITLQAVTFALSDAEGLARDERAVALDKASLSIRAATSELLALWRAEPLPESVDELVMDARAAHDALSLGGLEWRVTGATLTVSHAGPLAESLVGAGFEGDLMIPGPALPLYHGSPAAFVRDLVGGPPDPSVVEAIASFLGAEAGAPVPVPAPRQVYRQFDFALGRPVRDAVHLLDDTLPAGQPLLNAVVIDGVVQPVPMQPRVELTEPLEVVFAPGAGMESPEAGSGDGSG